MQIEQSIAYKVVPTIVQRNMWITVNLHMSNKSPSFQK